MTTTPVPTLIQRAFYFLNTAAAGNNAPQFVSDIPAQTLLSYRLILPSWFPRKALICGVTASVGFPVAAVGPTEFWMDVDPKGKYYKQGVPPGAQNGPPASVERMITLLQVFVNGTGMKSVGTPTFPFSPPILLDRDNGDKLWFGVAGNDPIDWAYFNLAFQQVENIAADSVGTTY